VHGVRCSHLPACYPGPQQQSLSAPPWAAVATNVQPQTLTDSDIYKRLLTRRRVSDNDVTALYEQLFQLLSVLRLVGNALLPNKPCLVSFTTSRKRSIFRMLSSFRFDSRSLYSSLTSHLLFLPPISSEPTWGKNEKNILKYYQTDSTINDASAMENTAATMIPNETK
jgi:hypothetical protein